MALRKRLKKPEPQGGKEGGGRLRNGCGDLGTLGGLGCTRSTNNCTLGIGTMGEMRWGWAGGGVSCVVTCILEADLA